MANEHQNLASTPKSKLYREQIITTDDLYEFKTELLDEIKLLFKEHNGQPSKKWLKSYEVRKILNISPGTLQNLRVKGIRHQLSAKATPARCSTCFIHVCFLR